MRDRTHIPREIPYSVENLEELLSDAIAHASHGWRALEKVLPIERLNPEDSPPRVEAEVGSAEYHLSIVLTILWEAHQAVRKERKHTREVMKRVNEFLESKKDI